ncbi:hypothetical protein F373_gp020 [Bacillus phage SP-10]|uniref:hypothetical protein n=1 Tax=Bacillus phage SP10 TaxID=941058 RepID=UPI0002198AE8|nr:hypothetical protein F373_gp020 [Bacillus phage SP-10]BAK52832.1 hypothetical protein [Bacillus phage SP-10]
MTSQSKVIRSAPQGEGRGVEYELNLDAAQVIVAVKDEWLYYDRTATSAKTQLGYADRDFVRQLVKDLSTLVERFDKMDEIRMAELNKLKKKAFYLVRSFKDEGVKLTKDQIELLLMALEPGVLEELPIDQDRYIELYSLVEQHKRVWNRYVTEDEDR